MICRVDGCTEHYGCQLRAKSIQVDTRATPSRRRLPFRPTKEWAWAKGRVGERRAGGTTMPYLSPGTLNPMGVYEFQHRRSSVERQVRTLKSDPNVFRAQRETA